MENEEWSKNKVEEYKKMVESWNSPQIIFSSIYKYVDKGLTILELGSAVGKDAKILEQKYDITTSDYSSEFFKYLPEKTLKINAKDFKVESNYDCIYANKVLQVFSPDELKQSFQCQYEALKKGGHSIVTIWNGDGEEEISEDIINFFYSPKEIEKYIGDFKILDIIKYEEIESDDSYILVLKK